jgi:hypothetical protein
MGHHEIGFRRVLQHTLKAAMHSRQQNSSSLSMAVPNVLGTTGLPDMRPKDIPHAGTAGVRRACSVLVEFYEVERSSEFRRNWNMAGFDNTQIASCQRMRQCDDYPIHTFLIYHGFHGVSLGGSQHLFVELCSCTLSSHQTEDQTTIPGIQAPNFLQRQAAPFASKLTSDCAAASVFQIPAAAVWRSAVIGDFVCTVWTTHFDVGRGTSTVAFL